MLRTPKTRRGFTITEILIAVLLVLILSAIAVPRLLGNQRQADDASAKAQLRTAAEVARNLMYEAGNKFDVTKAGANTGATNTSTRTRLQNDEPNIQFVDGNTASSVTDNRRSVSVAVTTTPNKWIAASLGGKDGDKYNCWIIVLDPTGADSFGVDQSTANNSCKAQTYLTTVPKGQQYDFPSL